MAHDQHDITKTGQRERNGHADQESPGEGFPVEMVVLVVQLDGDRRVQCRHNWSPIALCLLVYFIIGYIINKKFMEIRCIRNQYLDDKEKSEKHKLYLEKLKEMGYARFNYKDVEKKRREELESNTPALKKAGRKELQNITSLKKVVKDLEGTTSLPKQVDGREHESITSLKKVVTELESNACTVQ